MTFVFRSSSTTASMCSIRKAIRTGRAARARSVHWAPCTPHTPCTSRALNARCGGIILSYEDRYVYGSGEGYAGFGDVVGFSITFHTTNKNTAFAGGQELRKCLSTHIELRKSLSTYMAGSLHSTSVHIAVSTIWVIDRVQVWSLLSNYDWYNTKTFLLAFRLDQRPQRFF